MDLNSKKCVIVTGASRGIGKEVALRLARDGFPVVVGYAGNQDKADAVVNEIRAARGKAIAAQADVSREDDVDTLFASAIAEFDAVHGVVSNAGVMSLAPISSQNVKALDQMINVNVRGTFLVLAKAAEILTAGGRIVALSSSVLAKAPPGYGPYIASKSAVEGLVHVLANELRGRNITVNAIAPGPVGTELFLKGKTDAQVEALAQASPLERLGEPGDVAAAVSFLLGPDGAWVNSQTLRVNGGFAF